MLSNQQNATDPEEVLSPNNPVLSIIPNPHEKIWCLILTQNYSHFWSISNCCLSLLRIFSEEQRFSQSRTSFQHFLEEIILESKSLLKLERNADHNVEDIFGVVEKSVQNGHQMDPQRQQSDRSGFKLIQVVKKKNKRKVRWLENQCFSLFKTFQSIVQLINEPESKSDKSVSSWKIKKWIKTNQTNKIPKKSK